MRSVLIYVIIGIGIGAMMHGYVPEGFFEHYMARDNWFTVPLAVVLAVPMYANAAGIVPIIEVFVAKGIPLGTAIAFMMGVVGLSLPEATLLKKVMTLVCFLAPSHCSSSYWVIFSTSSYESACGRYCH